MIKRTVLPVFLPEFRAILVRFIISESLKAMLWMGPQLESDRAIWRKGVDMSKAVLEKALELAAKGDGTSRVRLAGGEPALVPDSIEKNAPWRDFVRESRPRCDLHANPEPAREFCRALRDWAADVSAP
jgi:hypothetical protein